MAGARKLVIEILGDSKGLSGAFKDAGDASDGFGKKLGGAAKIAGGAILGIGGAAAVFGPMVLSAGAELDALGKKSATVFEGSLGQVEKWADANAAAMGLTARQATGVAAGIGDLLKPMGFTADAAAGMATQMMDMSGALSAWSGGQKSAAEVSDIITKAMLGETDGLKSLGISIGAADVQAKLAAKGQAGLTGAALEQAEALAIQELILEKSTDAQKAWADGSMDGIKAQNEAKASLDTLKETLIQAVYPALQALVPIVTEVAAWLGERLPGAIDVVKSWLVDNLGPVIGWVGDRFGELVGWVQGHWDQISATVETAIGYVRGAIQTGTEIVTVIWRTWGDNIVAYLSNAWDFVTSIVGAALDVIKGVVNVVMGIIRGDWSQAWDGIKGIVSGVWDAIAALVDLVLDNIATMISAAWNGIKLVTSTVWDAIKGAVMTPINAVSDGVSAAVGAIKSAISTVWDWVTGASSTTWNAVSSTISGVWEGIKGFVSGGVSDVVGFVTGLPGKIKTAVGDAFSSIWDKFKEVLNKIIGAWNNLGFTLPTMSFDWNGPLPGGDIEVGGWTISTPNLPTLAKGGVLTGSTLFLGGEYPGASSNPEIVTPESLMREAMADTLDHWMPSGGRGDTVTINVYPAGHVLSERDLVDVVYDGLLARQNRTGTLAFNS